MNAPTAPVSRIASIDIMRGVVILLMMMDHVRERFYMHVRVGDPIFDTIEPDLFFTRLATHLCAPIFIFLAGIGAWLYAHPRDGVYRSPAGFLLKRGVVIIAIEVVLYSLVWVSMFPGYLFLQVLWAIGLCMVALSAACRLPMWAIGALGFLIVFGHNLLEPISFEPGELGYIPWTILHDPGDLGQLGPLTVSLSYPALPWFGVILLGYFCGPIFARTFDPAARFQALISLGAACFALLFALRGFNIYGEAAPWSVRETAVETAMSFLNFTKYPPSLDFLLLTLGVGLVLLALLSRVTRPSRLLGAIETFGSVPMFIYVVHLYVLLAAYYALLAVFGPNQGARFGFEAVWWIWAGAFVLIGAHYPLAAYFSGFKHREKRSKPWLSYF
ncbi:MAG: heparan-alpha-glucosaminide N-acetyltransferase domain-containing protein [Pseudomonadota bacterium]